MENCFTSNDVTTKIYYLNLDKNGIYMHTIYSFMSFQAHSSFSDPTANSADIPKDQQSYTKHVLGRFRPQPARLEFRLNSPNQQRNKRTELNFKHLDVFALRNVYGPCSYSALAFAPYPSVYPKLNLPPYMGRHSVH